MSRIARVVVEGVPYHVTQRGNGRRQVFFCDEDYKLYLDLIRLNAARYPLQIWAYCLMPNHVHFVAVPKHPAALAKTFGRTHADYARYSNLRRRSCGHVWQARLAGRAEDLLAERLREATVRGRPFGAEEFVDELERKAERGLRPLPVGRPRKKQEASADEPQCVQLRLGIGI